MRGTEATAGEIDLQDMGRNPRGLSKGVGTSAPTRSSSSRGTLDGGEDLSNV